MAHQYRELLAYVADQDGNISVELITLTRNGLSYYFQDKRWRRPYSMFFNDVCTNDSGDSLKIAPLTRHSTPSWVSLEQVVISDSAKDRYEKWNKGNRGSSSIT
ncbi:hypothetical protein [Psychromonas algicola]|uniref:hypothetical protein n=1 Tax=Psychromonas algicola TaxID=2555642 RepID=UPI001067DC56|nr:hypothetical protein [Psychromonas sp. RZ5]TEW50170.1 hypothetical protein E2R67_09905 [Psychromonas sp. RZ5]